MLNFYTEGSHFKNCGILGYMVGKGRASHMAQW